MILHGGLSATATTTPRITAGGTHCSACFPATLPYGEHGAAPTADRGWRLPDLPAQAATIAPLECALFSPA
ncbi:hypothetical protein GCM10009733_002530 [Nonomuraea maheshkhaliensis]|uniref:Uncharacterized protein n=1 Tax=Nonomuraea maheshkhaliensis TaxID=419590 RepID=A0ABN2EK74_9ACTN